MVLKNARHERFAQFVAAGNSQAEAYRLAGFAPAGAGANATRLIANDSVSARITELQEEEAEKLNITKEYLTKRLVKTGDDPDCPPAVQVAVVRELADIHGLHAPSKVDARLRRDLSDLSDEEIERMRVAVRKALAEPRPLVIPSQSTAPPATDQAPGSGNC